MNINPNITVDYQTNTKADTNSEAELEKTINYGEKALSGQTQKTIGNQYKDVVMVSIQEKSKALKIKVSEIVENHPTDRIEATTSLSNALRSFEKYQAKINLNYPNYADQGKEFDIYMEDGVIKISSDFISEEDKQQLEAEMNQDEELVDEFTKFHDSTLNVYNTQVKLRNLHYNYKEGKGDVDYAEDDTLKAKKDIEGKLKLVHSGEKFMEHLFTFTDPSKMDIPLADKIMKIKELNQTDNNNLNKNPLPGYYDKSKDEHLLYSYYSPVLELNNITDELAKSLGVKSMGGAK